MRKKILVDIYLAFNLGDDMFLDYLANTYPDVDFVPFHPGNNYDVFFSNYKNVSKFPYSLFDKVKTRLGFSKLTNYDLLSDEFDGLLFLGGGIFREENYWKRVYEYRNGITDKFVNKQKPVWFAGCNFGNFKTEYFLKSYKTLFAKVNKITFRDTVSYSFFKEIPSVDFASDILWSYDLPESKKEEKVLGISVIDPRHKEGLDNKCQNYIEAHKAICQKFLKQGYKVKIFSFCEQEGDKKIAELIAENINEIEIINYSGDIKEFLLKISICSHFVAARFHANIIAMKYKMKFIPIIYGNKTENLLLDLGFHKPFMDLNSVSTLSGSNFLDIDQSKVNELAEDSKKHFAFKFE